MFQHEHSFHTIILTTAISHTIYLDVCSLPLARFVFFRHCPHLTMQIPRNVGEYVLRTRELVISGSRGLRSSLFRWHVRIASSQGVSLTHMILVKRGCGSFLCEEHYTMMLVSLGGNDFWNRIMSFARWRGATCADDDSAGAAHVSKVAATNTLHSRSVETPCFRGRVDHPWFRKRSVPGPRRIPPRKFRRSLHHHETEKTFKYLMHPAASSFVCVTPCAA